MDAMRDRAARWRLVVTAAALLAACSETSRLNLSCTAGDIDRCEQLAVMYATGSGAPQDTARAASLYERVCDAGRASICNDLGEIYEKGSVPGVSAARVSELFTRACEGGSAFGCVNLGLLTAAEDDDARAVELFERGCTGGATAGCYHLALALEAANGVPRDLPRAVQLHDQACEGEFVDSCLALATLFSAGGDVERDAAKVERYGGMAVQVLDASCKAGEARDCEALVPIRTRVLLLQRQAREHLASGPATRDDQR
jgi:hypothetical protein